MSGSDGSEDTYYRSARRALGVAIILVLLGLFIADRPPDGPALVMMLTTAILLLGVDGARLLLGR